MNTKCRTCRVFTAVTLISMISISMAEKYLVIPIASQTATTCDGPDEVVSGGGRCWKDRNLGSTSVARFEDDGLAYGDLYQWGRIGEGHQNRNSPFTTIKNANDVPGHSNFIGDSTDWRSPSKEILWQGLSGINNPCPQGFRIPTKAEWDIEIASWVSPDIIGAWKSPLKLAFSGLRDMENGAIKYAGVRGFYWSSTVSSATNVSGYMRVTTSDAYTFYGVRALGMSVRCIKD